MIPSDPSAEMLREEVLNQARSEGTQIIARAKQEVESILEEARHQSEQLRARNLAVARLEAERRSQLIAATVTVEVARRRLAFQDALLERIHGQARQKLLDHTGFNYPETVTRLVAAAMSLMDGNHFTVKLSPADRTDFGGLLASRGAEILNRSGAQIEVVEDLSVKDGAMIHGSEGHQAWDCRLSARLDRLWPSIRDQLALQLLPPPKSRPGGTDR